MTDILIKRGNLDTETDRQTDTQGECHVKMKVEIRRSIYKPRSTRDWQQTIRSLTPWSWTSGLQYHATTHFCCPCLRVCGMLLGWPSGTHTRGMRWLTYGHSIKERTMSLTLPLKEEEKEERREKKEEGKKRTKMHLDWPWLQWEKLPSCKKGFTYFCLQFFYNWNTHMYYVRSRKVSR